MIVPPKGKVHLHFFSPYQIESSCYAWRSGPAYNILFSYRNLYPNHVVGSQKDSTCKKVAVNIVSQPSVSFIMKSTNRITI